MSVWAKADPRSLKVNADKGEKMTFKMAFGRLGEGEFELTDQWKRYEIVIAPQQMVRKGHGGAAGSISLIGEGTAWFDALEVNPEIYMATELTPDGKGFVVNMLCNIEDGEIRYTTDGSEPTQKSKVYTSPIEFRDVRTVKARVFDGDKALNTKTMLVAAHKALGAKVAYNKPWTKYTGGGETALTDGKFATMNYQSPMWQGYRGNDIDVTVDLGEVKPINKITTSYLYSLTAWVVPPSDIEFEISEDGKTFAAIGAVKYGEAPKGIGEYDYVPVSIVKDKIGGKKARYIHIKAKHPLGMPSWRNVQGDSWMFIDEIVVE